MKTIRTLAASTILLAIAALSAYAQGTTPAASAPPRPTATPATTTSPVNVAVPVSKIAFVNTEAFGEQKDGIGRFVGALQSLQREFKPKADELQSIQAKIQQVSKDIETLSKATVVDPKSIQAKQEEGGRLEREHKYKKEDYDGAMQKRYREVVGPVSIEIGNELDAFANERGITMILDVSKLLPAVLTAKEEMDITKAFIAFYNSRHPATAPATTP